MGTTIEAAISAPRAQLWPRWRIHRLIGTVMSNLQAPLRRSLRARPSRASTRTAIITSTASAETVMGRDSSSTGGFLWLSVVKATAFWFTFITFGTVEKWMLVLGLGTMTFFAGTVWHLWIAHMFVRRAASRSMSGEVKTVAFTSAGHCLHGRLGHCADEAPTFVLLSGIGFHTFEYESLARELLAMGFNALSFDFRGHGRSDGPRGRWTLDQLAADTERAVEFVCQSHRGPIALYGNSLGAMVAILAGARDERTVGVAAANCPARIADFMLTRPRRALYTLATRVRPLVRLRISLHHFYSYEQLIDDPTWVSTIRRDRLIPDARRLSMGTYAELLDVWDGASAVGQIRKPLLLIQGRRDRFQPPEQSQLLYGAASEPKRYEEVDTGHIPHMEDPERVATLLAAWLRDAS